MISHVFKPKRTRNGKTVISRLYRGRYRLDGDFAVTEIALGTADKQVAEKKLREIIKEKEQEKAGIIAPKLQRTSAERPLSQHTEDFIADLDVQGRSQKYRQQTRARITRLMNECRWTFAKDINANDFVGWRSDQKDMAPKTLNEYLNATNAFMNWMTKQGRIGQNPLFAVNKVDIRGRQQKRRALTVVATI